MAVRDRLWIPPLPKNMHPEHHTERREKRAQMLSKKFSRLPPEEVAFVDAAGGASPFMVAAVSNGSGRPITAVTLKTRSPEAAEEVAVALACAQTKARFVICDSKTAIRNYSRGLIAPQAIRILQQSPISRTIQLIWTPSHTGVPGNESAHAMARGSTTEPVAERADLERGP